MMMKKLVNATQGNAVIANDVRFATSFLQRAIGLMGRKNLPAGQTLFFPGTKFSSCNSVQTTFMRFAIDVVFVDGEMKVLSVIRNLKPWRVTWPVAGAISAFEFTAGQVPAELKVGDVLYVGD